MTDELIEVKRQRDQYCYELEKARAVIRNTSETVQAFREEVGKAKAEAEKARMDWHAAENELWLGELREQIEKLREQRDRAMAAASGLANLDDEGWECYVGVIIELLEEIKKEKEPVK